MNITSIVSVDRNNIRGGGPVRWMLRVLAGPVMWGIAGLCFAVHFNRSTTAMLILLAVLAVATSGDAMLALVASAGASLGFSWYFIEAVGSLRITSAQGWITFIVMTLTALIGSQLSAGAQRRAAEAERRRGEMEQLNELGRVLLSAETVAEAAASAVRKLVDVFGLEAAAVRLEATGEVFEAGVRPPGAAAVVFLGPTGNRDVLETWGNYLSDEVRSALARMIGLVLERARAAEAHARTESTRRGEELRATVLNALAHDFRTPLTSIKLAASALRHSRDASTPETRELVSAIDEEADRLDRLIQESLDLAKLESYRGEMPREECNLREIVGRIALRVSRYLDGRDFVVDLPGDLPLFMADRFLIEQMLIPVIDNARKYSALGAKIEVSARSSQEEIFITIRNEGSEIQECERDRIFDRFYRGARERTRIEGTGLGLAIAKTIAEAFGGKVWLEMEPKGPAFHFALPMEVTGNYFDREPHDFADRR